MAVEPVGRITKYRVEDTTNEWSDCFIAVDVDGYININQDRDTVVMTERDFLELAERIKENR